MKRIIIIGASSGIGRELALLYAGRGHQVAITGRRTGMLEEVKSLFPDKIITATLDVTGDGNIPIVQRLIDTLGGLDLFIYNAGFGHPSETLDPGNEMITTKTNVVGFVELTAFVFLYFASKEKGRIAVTSSVAALRGNSWTPAYSASKAFISNYAEGLNIKAQRWQKDIIVTDIRPGFVDTKMAKANKRFWVSTASKAARQIAAAIADEKRVAYISRRWWLIAQLMKRMPYALFRRLA